MKYIQNEQYRHQNDDNKVILVSLLLISKIFFSGVPTVVFEQLNAALKITAGQRLMTRKKRCGYTLEFRHPIIHILNLATWTEIVLLFYENIQNFNLNLDCLSTLRSFWKTFWAKRYVKSKIVFSPQLERNTKYDWPMYNPYFRSCKCRLRILGENLEITKNIYKKTIDKSVPSFDSKKW